ncbi:hypothetical protein V8E53_014865 [Lactarius tabidus]
MVLRCRALYSSQTVVEAPGRGAGVSEERTGALAGAMRVNFIVGPFPPSCSMRVVYEASQPSGVVTLAFEKDGDLTPCPWKWENVDSHGTRVAGGAQLWHQQLVNHVGILGICQREQSPPVKPTFLGYACDLSGSKLAFAHVSAETAREKLLLLTHMDKSHWHTPFLAPLSTRLFDPISYAFSPETVMCHRLVPRYYPSQPPEAQGGSVISSFIRG